MSLRDRYVFPLVFPGVAMEQLKNDINRVLICLGYRVGSPST